MEIAGTGMRVLGAFADLVALFLVAIALSFVIGTRPETGYGFSFVGKDALIFFVLCLAYFIVTEATWGGSPGKLLLDMRVVNEEDGGKIGWQKAAVRNLVRIIDILPALYLVGFVLAVASPKNQRLGDRLAKTLVVRV